VKGQNIPAPDLFSVGPQPLPLHAWIIHHAAISWMALAFPGLHLRISFLFIHVSGTDKESMAPQVGLESAKERKLNNLEEHGRHKSTPKAAENHAN
jgi:hypothetical protein